MFFIIGLAIGFFLVAFKVQKEELKKKLNEVNKQKESITLALEQALADEEASIRKKYKKLRRDYYLWLFLIPLVTVFCGIGVWF